MSSTTTTQIQYLGDGNSQGTVLGKTTTDKIGFYGATPIVKATVTSVATTTATTTLNETRIGRLETALSNLGLIAMS